MTFFSVRDERSWISPFLATVVKEPSPVAICLLIGYGNKWRSN